MHHRIFSSVFADLLLRVVTFFGVSICKNFFWWSHQITAAPRAGNLLIVCAGRTGRKAGFRSRLIREWGGGWDGLTGCMSSNLRAGVRPGMDQRAFLPSFFFFLEEWWVRRDSVCRSSRGTSGLPPGGQSQRPRPRKGQGFLRA